MSDAQAWMRELCLLEGRRLQGALTPEDEQRWWEAVGALELDPAFAETGYYAEDGNWYPYPSPPSEDEAVSAALEAELPPDDDPLAHRYSPSPAADEVPMLEDDAIEEIGDSAEIADAEPLSLATNADFLSSDVLRSAGEPGSWTPGAEPQSDPRALELEAADVESPAQEPRFEFGPAAVGGAEADAGELASALSKEPVLEPTAAEPLPPADWDMAALEPAQPTSETTHPFEASASDLPLGASEPELELRTEEAEEPDPPEIALHATRELSLPFEPPTLLELRAEEAVAPGEPDLAPVIDLSLDQAIDPDLPAVANTSLPTAMRMVGEHRVVLHTLEGQVKRGILRDVDLGSQAILLEPQTGSSEELETEALKAIFFMLPPGGSPPPLYGSRLRVTLRDGRELSGFSEDHHHDSPGFFLVPAEARGNTARVFIYRRAVQALSQD